ncbi:RHS repeat-associated core domain-containing protein, partial [Shewanella sp.]|nr:RHS repeat-associated core domain-containing protein [Shewanella sp.]
MVWQANNLAFDREVFIDHIGGLNLGLPGLYYDSEKDSWQNGFRDYDAKTARYLQSDPIGLAGGNNLYRYALNSSLIWFDETGLGPKDTGGDPSEPPRDSGGYKSNCLFSSGGLTLLKNIEELRLQAYDDQTGNNIGSWVKYKHIASH